jgi:YHS domain-containing protein
MYRFLLILALLVIAYVLLRRAIRDFKQRHLDDRGGASLDHDQMVQDPVCRTFVPRKIAFVERIGGQTYCFCSRDCAEAFQKQQSS